MTGRILLSPIEKGQLRRPSAGSWHSADNFLDKFSQDILLEGSVEEDSVLRGVPSVFAQAIFFANALENADHPAHDLVHAQWRGLLACFALRSWLNLPLEVQHLEFGTSDSGHDSVFREVLQTQLPSPAEDWRDWHLLRCGGQLLGATSPWSLVYPAAQSQVPARIPWQREGLLIDPIDHYDERRLGSSRELSLLAAWVDLLHTDYATRWETPNRPPWDAALNRLRKALARWQEDLAPYRQPEDAERTLLPALQDVAMPYRRFSRAIDATDDKKDNQVLVSRNGVSTIILRRSYGASTHRILGSTLAGDLDLEAMPRQAAAGWTTRTGQMVDLPYVFPGEVLLTEKLLAIAHSENALPPLAGRFALPLTEEALNYIGWDDIASGRAKVEAEEQQDVVTVRLTLPLESGSAFSVERVYDAKRDVEVVNVADARALMLWPDFVAEDWRWYQAFVVSRRFTLGNEELFPFVITPLTDEGAADVPEESATKQEWTLWQSERPFVGFSIRAQEDGRPAGLILRRQPTPLPSVSSSRKWRVGMDFGTSNTQLMLQLGDKAPRPLTLEKRSLLLNVPSEGAASEAQDAFYPLKNELAAPFPTVLLQNRGRAVGETDQTCFSPRFDPKPDADLGHLVRNLKWPTSGGKLGDLPIRRYLEIVVRAILAEARSSGVKNLELHWSYPLALPSGPKTSMNNFWSGVSGQFSGSATEVLVAESGGRSESEAMSRYFASSGEFPVLADRLSIAIDVGGGSTDIGFWSNARFLDQTSFKLAGNDILVKTAEQVPGFVRKILELHGEPTDGSTLERVQKNPAVVINALLSRDPDLVPLRLHSDQEADQLPWRPVRGLIYLFYAGLHFYLGLHAQKLLNQVDRAEVAILVGGKGSGLLPWLAADGPTLRQVLGDMFLAGLSYEDPGLAQTDVEFYGASFGGGTRSASLKTEVAHGLLLPAKNGESPEASESVLLGERGWKIAPEDVQSLDWRLEVDREALAKVQAPENLEASFITYFTSRLLPVHAEALGLDPQRLGDLQLRPNDVVQAVRQHLQNGIAQPIFASELDQLMKLYLKQAAG